MPRYTEAILDLAFRQGFERKREREVEARRQQRQERIGQLLGQVTTQAQQQGPSISGAPLGAQPPIAEFSELATYGVNLPSKYIDPIVDVSHMAWPQEVKDMYYARGMSFDTANSFRDKTVKVTDKEIETFLEASDRFAAAFPGNPERGISQLDHAKLYRKFVKTGFAEIAKATHKPTKPSALSEKMQYADELIKGRSAQEVMDDPLTMAQLDIIGVNAGDAFGWHPERFAKVEETLRKEIIGGDITFGRNFSSYLQQWKNKELIGGTEQKNQKYSELFSRYYNRITGELKNEIVINKKARLDELQAQSLGYGTATEIPEDIRELVFELDDIKATSAIIDEMIKRMEEQEPPVPESQWPVSRQQLEKAKQYLGRSNESP